MGYRFSDNPPKPEDHLRKFAVRNGATLHVSFGCYYLNNHDPMFHDHIGWPNPSLPDGSCQEISNMRLFPIKHKTVDLEEIHLLEEGYTDAEVSYEDTEDIDYLTTNAWIDEEDDNIVRMTVATNLPTFDDKPKDYKFTIFVKSESTIDAVCHAVISVLPGAPSGGGQ